MKGNNLNYYYNKLKFGEDNFHDLMNFRIRKILLISTFYDAYIFEHDAKLSNQIVGEYHSLNLTTVPRIVIAPTGDDALEKMEQESFDLVITTIRIGELSPFDLSLIIHEKYPNLPVLLLLTVKTDITLVSRNQDKMSTFEEVFLWNGNPRLFLAMIKYVEDKKNVVYDTENGFVKVILLIEDSITFSSIYLPLFYGEIMEQTQRLISEEQNDSKKYYRMRTRPKVLLVRTFEDAIKVITRYKDHLMGIISDIEYTHNGEIDTDAGFKLIEYLHKTGIDTPVMLQSSDSTKQPLAATAGVDFLHKKSTSLLNDISRFIFRNLGFGSFVFRTPDGKELGRAMHLKDFVSILKDIPAEALIYHSKNDHFSSWLTAHGEFEVARRLKPVKVSDFKSIEEHKAFLIKIFKDVKEQRNRGKIIDFELDSLEQEDVVIRIGSGSLGGKGRGLAFFNALLSIMDIDKNYHNARIRIPGTTIIATGIFDQFMEDNNLIDVHYGKTDEEIKELFLSGTLPETTGNQLFEYISSFSKPIAVRSSGLLEDSQSQPFAGVYATYMLPNDDPDINIRFKQLTNAVKLVFASVFLHEAVSYIETLNYGIEEEKMAVVIQELVGTHHDNYFYPHFSGVAQSYNYYPISHMKNSDGSASLAVGLGQSIVGGGRNYMFSPAHPEIQYGSVEDHLKNSQTDFYALNMKDSNSNLMKGEEITLVSLPIKEAEKHKTLTHLASVWDYQNERIVDGLSTPGPRIVNFANILKYDFFPLSGILTQILDISKQALGIPVEIEFAVDLTRNMDTGELPTFYLLQVRPLSVNTEEENIDLKEIEKADILLYSHQSLGNGVIDTVEDIVFLDPLRFDNTQTIAMEKEIEEFNNTFRDSGKEYILIGPGRWGSRDRFLGIPVHWGQINRAQIIIEIGLQEFDVEPSQGSHFFHNLIAMNVGYFNIPYHNAGDSFLDWEYLRTLTVMKQGAFFTHVRSKNPLTIKMDGKKGQSLILK